MRNENLQNKRNTNKGNKPSGWFGVVLWVRLYNADCFDVMADLPDKSVDAVITDPPYGTTDLKWDTPFDLDKWWSEINRVCTGSAVVFADQPFSSQLVVANIKNFRYEWLWDRGRVSTALHAKRRPLKTTEDILVFSKKTPIYNIDHILIPATKTTPIIRKKYRHASGVVEENTGGTYTPKFTNYPFETLHHKPLRAKSRHDDKHPTQKPVDLMEHLVSIHSNEGDVVFDPFMGWGTTGVACKNLGRDFIGVEQNEHHYNKAGERLA